MTTPRTLILGTAGHVDHGKTTLIGALTGTDTDRLEEEHRRGISIELGFAHLDLADDLRLGIVDVPGHERFVRQMVSGAGGMDLAMLLVAADEGVMPQTREHFDVLRMLGVPAGLIVLTKMDMADPDLADVVEEEVKELVEGSFLEGAPIVRVSGQTKEGVDTLRSTLEEVARAAPVRSRAGHFRLPVDRVFVLRGTGVVVTGTAWSGTVEPGDTLKLLPQGTDVRVRDVQSHGATVPRAGAGERIALSVHGVKKEDLERGDQLVTPGPWAASTIVGARLTAVEDPELAARMRPRARVHVHHAARGVIGRIDPLEGEGPFGPGDSRLVRLLLEEPIIARPGDRLVVRTYSPMITAAGGVVLDPQGRKGERRARTLERLEALESGGGNAWAFVAEPAAWGRPESEVLDRLAMLGHDPADAKAAIEAEVEAGRRRRVAGRVVDAAAFDGAAERALERLRAHQESAPMTVGLPREELRQFLGHTGSSHDFARVLAVWAREHPVFVRGDRVRADTAEPPLDEAQREAVAHMESRVQRAEPLFEAAPKDLEQPALRLLVDSGRVIRLEGRLLVHRDRLDELARRVGEHFEHEDALEIGHVKEWTGASRKYVVPLMEWLDRAEVTRFERGMRRRGPRCPD
ncbi:MAG TPA: selenocysteine-specific translation elongation factor [Candidatus Krumholzibacteria bacterium]|nr:selenocysteine-specific translation elongation factor [Candidatus Krumholzibacteria bacterium]